MLKNIHKPILVSACGSHFLQPIETEWRKKKKNLNYITSADQPTDSRPPEATSASSANIDRILIFPTFSNKHEARIQILHFLVISTEKSLQRHFSPSLYFMLPVTLWLRMSNKVDWRIFTYLLSG